VVSFWQKNLKSLFLYLTPAKKYPSAQLILAEHRLKIFLGLRPLLNSFL
jgi:hypothetical protein